MLKLLERWIRNLAMTPVIAAITAAEVGTGKDTKVWDVTATADGDTVTTIAHGMSAAPVIVHLVPLLAKWHVSNWFVSAVTATYIELTKGTGATSGDAAAQCRVIAKRRTHIEA